MADEQHLKSNLQNKSQWMRIVYMMLFWVALYFSIMIIALLTFVLVIFTLITGKVNDNLRQFSAGLTNYINQIILFLTYNEERKPFPFAEWGKLEEKNIETEIETSEKK